MFRKNKKINFFLAKSHPTSRFRAPYWPPKIDPFRHAASQRQLFMFLPSADALFVSLLNFAGRVNLIDIPAITAMNENCVFFSCLPTSSFAHPNSCIHATRLASLTVLLVRFVVCFFLFVLFRGKMVKILMWIKKCVLIESGMIFKSKQNSLRNRLHLGWE